MVAQGDGVPLVALLFVVSLVLLGRRFAWGPALCALPVALFPPVAITVTKVHGVPVSDVVGLASAAMLLPYLRWLSVPNLGRALALPAMIAVFGTIEGGLRFSLDHQTGLILSWLAGAALGAAIRRDRSVGNSLLWLLAPTAALTILQFVGVPDFWAKLTHATLNLSSVSVGTVSRGFGPYGQPVPAGAACACLCALTATLKPRYWRVLTGLYLMGTVATLSRSAIIALGVAAVAMVVLESGPSRRRALLRTLAVALIAGAAVAVPSPLSRAFSTRLSTADSSGRVDSLELVDASVTQHFGSVLFGGGFAGAENYLASIGGEFLTGDQSGTLVDDEAVSFVYDFGVVPLMLTVCILVWLFARCDPNIRRIMVPPFLAVITTFGFFDGLQWLSTGFLLFVFVGGIAAAGPPVAAASQSATEASARRRTLNGAGTA
jgi:hypothetical protein